MDIGGENTVNQRIDYLIKALGYNTNSFAGALGFKGPSIANLLPSGRNSKPGFVTTHKILTTFREINPEWLMLGEGPMLRKDNEVEKNVEANPSHKDEIIDSLKMTIEAKDSEIKTLKEMIQLLKK